MYRCACTKSCKHSHELSSGCQGIQVSHTNFKNQYPTFTAEGTPLFKHLVVVHPVSFCPGISDHPGNLLLDPSTDTDGGVSL